MAPNRQTQTMEVVQPTSDSMQLKELPIKVGKASRITRCSSISYSEEESLVLDSRSEYFRSHGSLKKTSCFILSSVANTLNSQLWPGVSSGLDEDDRQEKVKQRVALEPEEKKEAVENDDKSSGFCWQQTRETADEKELEYTWKSTINEAKHAKTGKWLVNLASG